MSFLPDELKTQTFPCPNCKQFISSETNVCKFCSAQITPEMREFAVAEEINEKKRINLNRHKNYLILGIVLLGIGLFTIITPIIQINYSNNVNFNCLTPIFIIAGIVITIESFLDYRREKKN
jgi:RNA polymerase subunit RPABC4/transcription elongation factor Spt4